MTIINELGRARPVFLRLLGFLLISVPVLRSLRPRYMRRRRVAVIEVDVGKFPYMGYGATVAWLQAAYIAADYHQAKLVILRPECWPFGGGEPSNALGRYLKLPNADMPPGDNKSRGKTLSFNCGSDKNRRRWGYFDDLHEPYCLFGYKPRGAVSLESYRRQQLKLCYQLQPKALEEVGRRLTFLPGRYLVWHLRRGDKTSGPYRECVPVSVDHYVDATQALHRRIENLTTNIVICTDSPETLDEAAKAVRDRLVGHELFFDSDEKRWDGYCALHREGKLDGQNVVESEIYTAQKIVEIFRHSEALIGCNSSYIFRVGAMLRDDDKTTVSLGENELFRQYYPL